MIHLNNKSISFLRYEIKCISFVMLIFFAFSSCNTDEIHQTPQIQFFEGFNYISNDTILDLGDIKQIRILANCETDPITNLVISKFETEESVLLDTGCYSTNLDYTLSIIKSTSSSEIWTFKVMTKARKYAQISLRLNLSNNTQYSEIDSLNIIIGAQSNNTKPSFLSFYSKQTYAMSEAYLRQSEIDLIYYFDVYNATMSSPNESDAPLIFTGEYGLGNWNIKNETRYVQTQIDKNEFLSIKNDSALFALYDQINAKRKAKDMQIGQVWSFKTAQNKFGLFYIDSLAAGSSGEIGVRFKFQKIGL